MEDDSTKGLSNVIKGPWRTTKTITKAKTEKIAIDMLFVEDMAESVMIPMIHSFSENGLDIKKDEFVQEVGFMNEVVKSLVFRHLGYKHPMQDMIKTIMTIKTETAEDVYASFDGELVEQITKAADAVIKKERRTGVLQQLQGFFGRIILLSVILSLFFAFLAIYKKKIFQDWKMILLISIVFIIQLVLANIILLQLELSEYLIPNVIFSKIVVSVKKVV